MKLASISALALLVAVLPAAPAHAEECTGTTLSGSCVGLAWTLDTSTVTLDACAGLSNGGKCLGADVEGSLNGMYLNACAPACTLGVSYMGWLYNGAGASQVCIHGAALDCSTSSVLVSGQNPWRVAWCEPFLGCSDIIV